MLPPAERRRASRIVRLTLAIGLEAAAHAEADVSTLATVFASSGADGYNCHALCEQLASAARQIPPTPLHNSVHTAAAGYCDRGAVEYAVNLVLATRTPQNYGLADLAPYLEFGASPRARKTWMTSVKTPGELKNWPRRFQYRAVTPASSASSRFAHSSGGSRLSILSCARLWKKYLRPTSPWNMPEVLVIPSSQGSQSPLTPSRTKRS